MHVLSIFRLTGCRALILIHLFLLWLLYHCLVVFYSSRLKFAVADFRVQSETIFCRKMSFKIFSYILSCMKIFCTKNIVRIF